MNTSPSSFTFEFLLLSLIYHNFFFLLYYYKYIEVENTISHCFTCGSWDYGILPYILSCVWCYFHCLHGDRRTVVIFFVTFFFMLVATLTVCMVTLRLQLSFSWHSSGSLMLLSLSAWWLWELLSVYTSYTCCWQRKCHTCMFFCCYFHIVVLYKQLLSLPVLWLWECCMVFYAVTSLFSVHCCWQRKCQTCIFSLYSFHGCT